MQVECQQVCLVKKMEEAAAVKGMEVQIAAYPEAEMDKGNK